MLEFDFLNNNIKKVYKNLKNKNYLLNKKLFKNLLLKKKNIIKKINIFNRLKKNFYNIFFKRNIYKIKKIKEKYLKKINKNLKLIILKIPNLIHKFTFEKNKIIKKKIYKKNIIKNNKINFNFKISNKVCGKGFSFINQPSSLLYKALEDYLVNLHIKEHNYKYIIVPNILNFKSFINSGQIPKFIKKLFIIKNKKKIKYLIPTAEVSLINFMIKKNISSKFIPIKYISKTECYRNENLTNNKNIIKQKQFTKVELVQFVDNKNSYNYLKELIKSVEKIIKNLKISYRIIKLSKKNTGYNAVETYDFEVWIPSINNYCEVSSCSNLENYQAVRSNIKYLLKKKKEYFSILNGSGVALGRIFLAIIENYIKENKKIKVPKILKKYLKKEYIEL